MKENDIIESLKKVASLSRLGFDEEKLSILVEKAKNVLGYIEQLNEIDTRSVEPTSHAIEIEPHLREDSVSPFEDHDMIIDISPERNGNFFQVPKVIDGE